MEEKIYQWLEIADKFRKTIIIGNGASIAIDKCFSYRSLYNEATKSLLLSRETQQLFTTFDTQDFEFVLRMIWNAHQVNVAFNINNNAIVNVYTQIRDSLIQTVQRVHVSYTHANRHLSAIAGFLKRFDKVVSLNYDLLIYWAMLYGNSQLGAPWFKDCFVRQDRTFEEDFKFLSKPHKNATGATLVFYPHGNLILGANLYGQETKIVSDENTDLLETIVKRWTLEDCTPLFVSEGTSHQKYLAVQRHPYLHFIYNNVLQELGDGEPIAVYGWSMSDQDMHLLSALGKNRPKYLAMSVYLGSKDWPKFCENIKKKISSIYGFKNTIIYFFDSASPECWLNGPHIS